MPPRRPRQPRVATSTNANDGNEVRGLVDDLGNMLRDVIDRASHPHTVKREKLKKKESEGSLTTEGSIVVLTIALQKLEHLGRVRRVGGFVRPDVVFDLPKKRKRGGSSQQTRKSIRLIMEEEHEHFMIEHKAKWEVESERRVMKEREFWTSKFKNLVAELKGTGVQPVTPVNELNSGHGSCNPTLEKLNPVIEPNGEPNTIKKRLDLGGNESPLFEKNNVEVSEPRQNATTIGLDDIKDAFAPKQSSNILCQLAVDSVDNIVAIGKLIFVDVDSSNHLIHGMPLGENNVRVTVLRAIIGYSPVPVLVNDEILKVDDAVGSCVAWPKELQRPLLQQLRRR
ncbi:hypothetical protein ACLB2K_068299 [Fragaria x ananassa]